VASDHYTAGSMVGWWIPQLSSNTDSASAMAKFWSLQGMAGHYTDVFMVSSNDYTSFRASGYLRDHDPPDILDGRRCKRLV
jgi:hypothetical protein